MERAEGVGESRAVTVPGTREKNGAESIKSTGWRGFKMSHASGNNQVRFMARCVEDPSRLGDIMPVGFEDEGGGAIDDELEGKKDGFVSTLTRSYQKGSLFGGAVQEGGYRRSGCQANWGEGK